MDVGGLGCLHHLLVRHFSEVGSVADVLSYGGVKQDGLLGHDADLGAQPADVEVTQVTAVQSQAAGERVVEPLDQRDDGTLATPTGPHQSQSLARLHCHVQTLKNLHLWSSRVVEVSFIHCNLSSCVSLCVYSEIM